MPRNPWPDAPGIRTKDNAAAKTRSQTTLHAVLKMQIRARQKQITLQIKQIDKIIAEMITMDEGLSRKFQILISIPGIGQATAFSMLIVPLMICVANHCRSMNA